MMMMFRGCVVLNTRNCTPTHNNAKNTWILLETQGLVEPPKNTLFIARQFLKKHTDASSSAHPRFPTREILKENTDTWKTHEYIS